MDGIDSRLLATLTHLDIRPEQCAPLAHGWINEIYRVVWQGRPAALRLNDARCPNSGRNRPIELVAHRWAAQQSIAPRIFVEGPDFLLMELLDARHLTEADVQDEGTLRRLVAAVKLIHAGQPVAFKTDFRDTLGWVLDRTAKEVLIPDQLTAAVAVLDGIVPRVAVPDVLSHNDLSEQNSLMTSDGPYFVDWELASMASPYQDLVRFALLAGTERAEEIVLDAYFRGEGAIATHRWNLWHATAKVRLIRAALRCIQKDASGFKLQIDGVCALTKRMKV